MKVPGLAAASRFVMATKMLIDWLFDGNAGAIIYLRLYLHHMIGKGRKINDVPKDPPPPPPLPSGKMLPASGK